MKKILLIFLVLISGLNFTNVSAENDLSSYKNIIPAYWWSYELNNKLTSLDSKSSIIIINPSNGNFNKTEDIFKDEINKTKEKNNLAIGYTYTKYGNRDFNTVKNAIDKWLKYYPNIDGFFIDETSDKLSKLDYYKKIYNYIKSKNSNLIVVLNPGKTLDKSYFDIADNIISYENPCGTYPSYNIPNWLNKYDNKISFLGYNCSQEQYKNLKNKYGKYITYFTDDGKDGNPWDSFSKHLVNSDKNTNTKEDKKKINNSKYEPYNFEKFHNILNISKLTYPDSHSKVKNNGEYKGYKSDFFYATKKGEMIFFIEKNKNEYKKRCELRQRINGKDDGWSISENNIHILKAKVKLQKLSGTNGEEYTFLQMHSEVNPLLRIAVRKNKNDKKNHVWAIVRINTNNSGKRTNRHDLGEVNENNFDNFEIKAGNNNLIISRNGKKYVNKNISYWPEVKNYFKAGIYLSHDNNLAYNIKIQFETLSITKKNIIINNGFSNNTNNNIDTNNSKNTVDKTNNSLGNKNNIKKNYNTNKKDKIIDKKRNKVVHKIMEKRDNNIWKVKIENLKFDKINLDLGKYNKYYIMFKKNFNLKKEIIVKKGYSNAEYYDYLKSFNLYTNLIFNDIHNKNYDKIKVHTKGFRKIFKKLKKIK